MRKKHNRKGKRALIHQGKRIIQRINGKQPVHFLHLGKTGGTAIRHALKDIKSNRYVMHFHRHDVTISDIPRGEGVVFFLRDPIARYLSGFYSRQREGKPKYYSPWSPAERIAFSTFSTPNELAVALSSKNEEEREEAEVAMKSIGHVRSHYWDWFENEEYFMSRMTDIVFIGYQETLEKEFERLKVVLGLPESAALPVDDTKSHRNPKGLDKTLEDRAIENLRSWYNEDYKFMSLCRKLEHSVPPA